MVWALNCHLNMPGDTWAQTNKYKQSFYRMYNAICYYRIRYIIEYPWNAAHNAA